MKNYLIKYKELTEKILYEIKKEELENALKVMDERELLLKEMSNINIDKNIDLEKEQLIKLIKDHSKTYNISWKNSFVYNDDVVVLKIVEDFYRTRPLVVFKDKISDEDFNFLVNKIENK